MKKSFSLICAAIAASATLLSCVKENAENVTVGGSQDNLAPVQEVAISATLSDLATKVGFAPSYDSSNKPTGMELTWSEGDQLRVYNHDDRTKFDDFTLDAASAGSKKGVFVGTPANVAGATKFDVEVVGAEGFSYAAQTQPSDGVTSGLKYMAIATGLADYSSVAFTEFSSVLAITAKMPEGVAAKVKSVEVKASENIFDGADRLTVTFAQAGDAGEDGVLHFFATLPQGTTVIPAGTTLVAHFNAPEEEHDVYTRFVELGSDLSFAENKLNTISLNAVNSATYANASSENIGTEANPYLVGDKHQFNAIRSEISTTMAYFEMVDDIDMTGIAWVPINKTPANCFSFDGNNYTLSNVTSSGSQGYQSIFGCLSGTLKNLKVDKATMVAGTAHSGVVASHIGASGTTVKSVISNVTVTNSTLGDANNMGTKKFGILGGVVENPKGAEISDITISDCSVASSADYTGGMIAMISNATTISGTNTISRTEVYGSAAGGAIGYVKAATTMSGTTCSDIVVKASGQYSGGLIAYLEVASTITDCQVNASVTGTTYTGGFVGRFKAGNISNSSVSGTVTSTSTTVGGFIGGTTTVGADCTVQNCSTTANVTADQYAGGFVGTAVGKYISNSATGTITAKAHVGGFAGRTFEGSTCTFSKNSATGNVIIPSSGSGKKNAGGLIGYIGGNMTMTDCYATGKVGQNTSSGTAQTSAGLVALILNDKEKVTDVVISNCYATGDVYSYAVAGGLVGQVGVKNVSISDCVAWNDVVLAQKCEASRFSSAAFSGVTYPNCSITDCYRNPQMSLTAYWVPDMATFQHADVSSEHPLTDSNGVEMTDTDTVSGQAHYPHYPYHGKVESGKTLSALARDVLGWSADIWDFSGELPTLK